MIVLMLAISLSLPLLAACQDIEQPGGSDTETVSESETDESIGSESESAEASAESNSADSSESTESDETESKEHSESDTEPDLDAIEYENGDKIDKAGYTFDEEAFAITEHKIDESKAEDKSAAELLAMLKNKETEAGKVYRVRDQLVLSSDTKYYGNNSAILAEGGILIKDASDILIKELIIKGSISVENSSEIILFRLDIQTPGTAISVDKDCRDVAVKSCRIHTDGTAIDMHAELSSVYQNYISADKALISSGNDMAVQSNIMLAGSVGISASGKYVTVKNNVIEADKNGVGVELKTGSYNSLVALNVIRNAQRSVNVTEGYNCVVLLNSAIRITGERNTNLYVVENSLGGAIELRDNKYLLCDGNKFAKDGKTHTVINKGNSLYNGDGLHDVNSRLEAGADEELLPHTNKELFVGMERRGEVRDLTQPKSYAIGGYIRNMAKDDSVVIIPPGAYSASSTLNLQGAHSNTTVYAYGAYQEATKYIQIVNISECKNLNVQGLTFGYALRTSGQAQVLKKLGKNQLLIISSAGFGRDFGASDPTRFVSGGSGLYLFHPDSYTSWTEVGAWGSYGIVKNKDGELVNPDGTMTIQLTGKGATAYYKMVEVGEVLACRLNEQNDRMFNISGCTDVLFKDTVTYGYSDAMIFIVGGRTSGFKLYRHHNCAPSASVIDKETYDKYAALEKEYNVDLDIEIDKEQRYRGTAPRIGSIDASHILGALEGMSATSTLFENACDDATNQRGDSSCLHKVIDNGNGTHTIVYKANPAQTYYNLYKDGRTSATGIEVREFLAGDRIFIYASNGRILCDTTVIDGTSLYQNDKYVMFEEDYTYNGKDIHWVWSCYLYKVTVSSKDLNMSALEGYDLESEHKDSPKMDNKIIVDNLSRNSTGFTFDNVMVRNNRGRIMVKTRDVTIKNCTVKDTSYAGIVLSVESTWGESTVPQNVNILNCLFDGTSQTVNMNTDTKFAAIAIEGLGVGGKEAIVEEDAIPSKNIRIEGNVFKNVQNNYYLTVSAAENISIKNNIFETRPTDGKDDCGRAILVKGSMNIEISNNTYCEFATDDHKNVIAANNYKNLYGTDVTEFEKDKITEPTE